MPECLTLLCLQEGGFYIKENGKLRRKVCTVQGSKIELTLLHRISLFTYLTLGVAFFYYFKQIDVFALILTFLRNICPAFRVKHFFMLMNKLDEFFAVGLFISQNNVMFT
jgi:hypothetical protein